MKIYLMPNLSKSINLVLQMLVVVDIVQSKMFNLLRF
jgi:hypothetical protein